MSASSNTNKTLIITILEKLVLFTEVIYYNSINTLLNLSYKALSLHSIN